MNKVTLGKRLKLYYCSMIFTLAFGNDYEFLEKELLLESNKYWYYKNKTIPMCILSKILLTIGLPFALIHYYTLQYGVKTKCLNNDGTSSRNPSKVLWILPLLILSPLMVISTYISIAISKLEEKYTNKKESD